VRRLIIISAVAAVALGTAAAAADDYSRKLAPWGQLTQATEKPPGETAGSADVATEVLERQDVKSVLGRQVRSITGEDMGGSSM
jgi:hypothetical protein